MSPSSPATPSSSSSSPAARRRWRALLAGVALPVVLGGGAYAFVCHKGVALLHQRLAEQGMELQHGGESWSPLRGLTLTNATLRRTTADKAVLMELSGLHVDVLWQESWKLKAPVTRWRTEDATLVLHDAQGAVTLWHFTTDVLSRPGELAVSRLRTSDGTLSFDLSGKILMPGPDAKSEASFAADLDPLRATLAALNFKRGGGGFTVQGSLTVDAKPTPATWNADLTGKGARTEWRVLLISDVSVSSQLSNAGMKLQGDLKLAHGSGKLTLTREGWQGTPLMLAGTLTDEAGNTDDFRASNLGATGELKVAELSGSADLFALAQNLPQLHARASASVKFKTFPDILTKDFVWQAHAEPPEWSLGSVRLRKPAEFEITVREHPVTVDHLTGSASYQDKTWRFEEMKGRFLGSSFALSGNYDGEVLSKADFTLEALRLTKLKPWLGEVKSSLEESDLTLKYRGTICKEPLRSSGTGHLKLTHAPVVHVPLLDQTYEIFPTLVPREHRGGVGEFDVAFEMSKGVAHLDPFKARSEAVIVIATGDVDLVKRRVSGHARANLRGVVGMATKPLSHLLAEMEVSGPIDHIQVSAAGATGTTTGLLSGIFGGTKKTISGGSASLSTDVLRESLSLPFEALGLFEK